jgi:predicted  nucleic acid-binding Zn-ribbon protein
MTDDEKGLRERITRSGEDAIGKLASELLENPLVTSAIGRIFEAREKASQAQAVAYGALNLPSAADLERLTRRVRSVSQRLEAIEDGVDKLDRRMGALSAPAVEEAVRDVETGLAKRIAGIEEAVVALTRELHALREALPDAPRSVPSSQERLEVEATIPAAKPRRRTSSKPTS